MARLVTAEQLLAMPHDTFMQIEEKAFAWLDAGTAMVLVVDPGTRTVRVYRTKENITVLHGPDQLDASQVVPGWKLAVAEIFS